jgi:pyrimidine operon attenuation protein / uracil phosphoribosyltransferase
LKIREKSQLMSGTEIDRSLVRLAHEIVERNNGAAGLALIGIRRRGALLAQRLAAKIGGIEGTEPPFAALDITFYRDDLSKASPQPQVKRIPLPFAIEDALVILVDDVLYTGRTVRAALDALVDYGRPRRVELCVLIDRGHRELPIQANYVGRTVQTSSSEVIEVRLQEVDREERVVVSETDG